MELELATLNRVFDQLSSIEAQLRSIRDTAGSNIAANEKRLTGLEAWTESHERLDEERYSHLRETLDSLKVLTAELKGGLDTLAEELGKETEKLHENLMTEVKKLTGPLYGRVSKMEEVHTQTEGARKLLKGFAWAAGLLLVVDKVIHLLGGHVP